MAEWGHLWETHYSEIYAFIHWRVHFAIDAEELAEDLTSEVFIKAIKATREDEEITQVRAWLFKIAKRHLMDFYLKRSRREKRKKTVCLESAVDEPDSLITPYEQAMSNIGCETIWQHLYCLPETERKVLLMQVEGYGIEEKADMLGKTAGATRMVLHRARQQLKELLQMRGYEI